MTALLTISEPAVQPVECEGCHRLLSDPQSRERRRGPVCWRRLYPPPARVRAGPAARCDAKPRPDLIDLLDDERKS